MFSFALVNVIMLSACQPLPPPVRPRVRGAAGMAQRGLLREGRSARQRRAPAQQGVEGSHPEGLGHVGADAGEGRRDGGEREQANPGRHLHQQAAQDRPRQERHEGGRGQGEKDG